MWGAWHLDVFRRFGAPSLLPQLTDRDQVVIHTTQEDHDAVVEICPQAQIIVDADWWLTVKKLQPRSAHAAMWQTDIRRAQIAGTIIALAWPDVVWGPTMFQTYRKLLGEEKTAIVTHLPRIALDGCEETLARARTNRDLARIALEHEDHLGWMYRADGGKYPEYCDMVNWRTENGVMTRLFAMTPVCFDPLRHELSERMLLKNSAGARLGFIGDTDEAIALSIAPVGKETELMCEGNAPDPVKIRAWSDAHFSPANAELAKLSHYLHGADLRPLEWLEIEKQADELAAGAFA